VRVGDVPARIGGVRGCHLVDADPDALAHGLEVVMAGPATVDPRAAAEQSLEAAAERLLDLYDWVLARQGARETRDPISAATLTATARSAASPTTTAATAAGREAR
jgi:hypothetical protein